MAQRASRSTSASGRENASRSSGGVGTFFTARWPDSHGNKGEDGTEGARRLNAYGTYLHGSLLPKNPWFTDHLILSALRRVDGSFELEPLDDALELRAFEAMAARLRGGGAS